MSSTAAALPTEPSQNSASNEDEQLSTLTAEQLHTISERQPMRWPSFLALPARSSRHSPPRRSDRRSSIILNYLRSRERNFISAFFSLLAVTLLAASLADEEWFAISGGKCPLKHLGTTLFYLSSRFELIRGQDDQTTHTIYITGSHKFVDCVTPSIVDLFHTFMALTFVALATNLTAFIVDLGVGSRRAAVRWLQKNAFFSVISVVLCTTVIGLCYWTSVLIEEQQKGVADDTALVRVAYEDGFYLVVCSALMSICSVAANLLSWSLALKRRTDDRLSLLQNMEPQSGGSLFGAASVQQGRPSASPFTSANAALLGSLLRAAPPPYSP